VIGADIAVALAALDAVVRIQGPDRFRAAEMLDFCHVPGDSAENETSLEPNEASTLAGRSLYVNLREHTSRKVTLISAAIGLNLDGRLIRDSRIALGGVGPKPRRLRAVEAALLGIAVDDVKALRTAVERGFSEASPSQHTGFVIERLPRLIVCGLQPAGAVV
jgi:xanthine dehydrogenase YagS FAD-binding subunit